MAPRKPISVMGMGLGGVNLVKNALILDENEVTLAQNAVPFSEDGGVSGIRKRDGWQRVVPTGSVSPGSDAGGAILGGFTIDDPIGFASPDGPTKFASGQYQTPGGSWTTYTPLQGSPPAPNTCYKYFSGFTTLTSAAYPPVAYPSTGAYYYGGHESGQILECRLVFTPGVTPTRQVQVREVARVVGTGSVDDTFICAGMYAGNLVIALNGGGVWLFNPIDGSTTKLPTLSATVSGAAEAYGRLWVASGLSIYSIGPAADTGYEASWTTAATVSDSGVQQLFGLALHIGSGKLFAGSYVNTSPSVVRMYAFTLSVTDGTASAIAFPTDGTTGPFNGPASVQVQAAPAWMIPYPMLAGDDRLYAQYEGNAAAFVQLLGAASESMQGTSLRLLSYDGSHWHNGVDTNTGDIGTDWMNGVLGNLAALAFTLDGRYQYAGGHYTKTGVEKVPNLQRIRFFPTQPWEFNSPSQGSAISATSFWDQPEVFF